MLDRQINLFKVDTNAFLTQEEKDKRKKLVKLKKVREKIYKKVGNREKSIQETVKKLIEQKKYGKHLDKYEEWLIRFTNVIKDEEKAWKEFILKSASDAVEYNNTHEEKCIRTLDERYLSYIDQSDGVRKVNLSNVISMFESTLSRSFGIKVDELTYDIFVLEIF